MADIKIYLQFNGLCKDKSMLQMIHIFSCSNACETSYIGIYVNLLSITFIYSVLLPDAYHKIMKSIPHRTCIKHYKIAVLSNIISISSNYTSFMSRKPLNIKKNHSCSSYFSLSGYKITTSGHRNVCGQGEGMVKPISS